MQYVCSCIVKFLLINKSVIFKSEIIWVSTPIPGSCLIFKLLVIYSVAFIVLDDVVLVDVVLVDVVVNNL